MVASAWSEGRVRDRGVESLDRRLLGLVRPDMHDLGTVTLGERLDPKER